MRNHNKIVLSLLVTLFCIVPIRGVFAGDAWVGTLAGQAAGAAANSAAQTVQENSVLLQLVNLLIKVASRWWTIVAFLAGKLMSNEFLYWEWLKLDQTLFNLWNYMKTFANFTLGFLFVGKILKSLYDKDTFKIKSELPKFLLASIVINMSWFLMGTLIDFSNVATAAVWAFPQALISDDTQTKLVMQSLLTSTPDKQCLGIQQTVDEKCNKKYDIKWNIDSIWARMNDMSWPLLFIGSSIYRFQDYEFLNKEVTDFKSFTTGTILKLLMLLMFLVPLLALLIINLKRVFYVWMWIIFSPFIFMFKALGINPPWDKNSPFFNISEMIWLIFQPVLVIGWISLTLILSVGMYSVMWWNAGSSNTPWYSSQVLWSAEIASAPWQSTFYNTSAWTEITYVGDVFRDVASFAWWLVWYLVITTFVILLLWWVVKMSTAGSSIASQAFKNVVSLAEGTIMSANFIPMWGSYVSLWWLMDAPKSITNIAKKWVDDMTNKSIRNAQWSFYNWVFGKAYEKMVWVKFADNPTRDIHYNEAQDIINAGKRNNSLNTFIAKVSDVLRDSKKSNKDKTISLASKEFRSTLFNTLNNNSSLKDEVIKALDIKDAKEFTEEKLFANAQFITYLQERFRGDVLRELGNTKAAATMKITPSTVLFWWTVTNIAAPAPENPSQGASWTNSPSSPSPWAQANVPANWNNASNNANTNKS